MAREQISSILRALQILECFTDNETEWTLKALVKQLDMPTTTVFRQVSTLTAQQYLIQDPVRSGTGADDPGGPKGGGRRLPPAGLHGYAVKADLSHTGGCLRGGATWESDRND